MRTVFILSSHHIILKGLLIAAGKYSIIEAIPPDIEGAISNESHTTNIVPMAYDHIPAFA